MKWFKKNSNNLNKKNNMKVLATWAAIVAFFSFDTTKENVLTEDHVEKLNAELTRLNADNKKFEADLVIANNSVKTLTDEKNDLQTKLDTATGTITKHEATIAENKTTIESLKQVPGAEAKTLSLNKETGAAGENSLLDFVSKNEENTADCIERMRKGGY